MERDSPREARGADAVRALVGSLFQRPNLPEIVYGISDMDMLERNFPEYSYSSGNPARLQAGIPSRFLYSSSQGPVYSMSDHLLNRESRYLPQRVLKPYVDLTIVGNTVMFLTERDDTVVARAVTSDPLAKHMRELFERLWASGE